MEKFPRNWPPFYLMRHAQSITNMSRIIGGQTETDLSTEGLGQAKAAGDFVRTLPITQIYCSPLRRARQTLGAMNLSILATYDKRLIETDYGKYAGKSARIWRAEGWSSRVLFENPSRKIPDGESFNDATGRGLAFMGDIKSCEVSLAVSHGNFTKLLLMCLFPSRAEELLARNIANCEIFRVESDGWNSIYRSKRSPEVI